MTVIDSSFPPAIDLKAHDRRSPEKKDIVSSQRKGVS